MSLAAAQAAERLPGDAALWRAIVVGFGIAMIAGIMMALALGMAGVAAPAAADAPQAANHAAAHATTDARPMPVP